MTILIINNYPDKKDLHKIDRIKNALIDLGESEVLVWGFSEINDQLLPQSIEAIILSGSDSHLDKPENIAMYQSEIEFVKKVDAAFRR